MSDVPAEPATRAPRWPPLGYDDWAATKATLHRYAQVVGKIRMALMPFHNHWWHLTLFVSSRGLTTGPMPTDDGRSVEVHLDLLNHETVVLDSAGGTERFGLRERPACADFYAQLFAALGGIGVEVAINPEPFDLDGPALSVDRTHDAYDAEAVTRYWTVLLETSQVMEVFAGRFNAKQAPIHMFWHSFDLALARFSGRSAPRPPGTDPITAEAYSHEVIAFGFWPGDDTVRYPACYSYTAPAPDGLTDRPLEPAGATWLVDQGSAHLSYEEVRTSTDPSATLLAFLESAYQAGATTAGWDTAALRTRVGGSDRP
ncbi:DUF5996 family protein [soil metagenome]